MDHSLYKYSKRLEDGLGALGISLEEPARRSLLDYCALLGRWNRTYNLTSITDPEQMISHHLLDSLSVSPHLLTGRVIDVGTGPGLPGIPLAIAHPDQPFVLLDSNGKKTRFLIQVVAELGLNNIEVVNKRVENYRPSQKFDVIISRAFSSIVDMLQASEHLLAQNGRVLAMKGKYPQSDLEQLPSGFQLLTTIQLVINGLDAERHLLMLGRT